MLTLTRKDMLLTINDNVIPALGSSDVPVKFVNDTETYVDFLIEPRVGYYVNGCPKSGICEYDTSSNIIKIPAEAFKNKGILVISIALIDSEDPNHIEVTKELALEVTPAPNGTVILPATDTWQTAVNNLVEQLYNQDYKPQFDEIEENLHNLVKEAQNQQNKANNQQTQIDNAIDVMGDYEIVQDNPTQIRFKKGDGTYGDTVNLGDNLASKSMVNAGYDTYSGNSYSGSASDYGIEVAQIIGAYEQDGTPTPEAPIEPQFVEINNFYTSSKNIIKNVSFTEGYYLSSDNELVVSLAWFYSNYFKLEYTPKQIYLNNISGNVPSICFYDSLKNFISGEQYNDRNNFIVNVPENAKYIRISLLNINFNDGEIYERYNSKTISLELRALPNGVCDTYENGIVTRRVGKVVFDGSDDGYRVTNYTPPSSTNNFGYYAVAISGIVNVGSSANIKSFLANKLQKVIYASAAEEMSCYQINTNIVVFTNEYITKEEFISYLKSNPITLYYQLDTPTTEQVDLPVIPSYYPFTNAWHDSEVEASDLTWNILARQYGSGQTTIKKDEAVLTELYLNTERTANPTTVKVQLQDSEGKVLYLETSSENIYIQSGRFSGKTVQQVLENSIQAISVTDEYIEVDVPDSMTQSIDEEFLVDEVDESETETE